MVETALARSGSAAQSKVQTYPGVFRSRATRAVRYTCPENTKESAVAKPVGHTRYADQELLSIIPSRRAGLEYLWRRPI